MENFVFEKLQAHDVEDVAALLVQEFTLREPLGLCVPMKDENTYIWAHGIASGGVEENLSLVVREASTRKLAGFLVCTDLCADNKVVQEAPSPKSLGIIFGMIQQCEAAFFSHYGHAPKHGAVVSLNFLAVSPDFGGRGLASELWKRVLQRCRDSGYRYAVSECSGALSRRVAEKNGMKCTFMVRYDEYEWQGVKPFMKIAAEHRGMALMECKL
eukprot:TRINITY_DN15316_c0_g1_i1.p1 TRINITY_DN15316_c0_g1~~TRINITY_DN15316_c0_g1_i1.p1  ORF type:complete len:214 (-),score=42.84 TRINITY_DN15316_c0_g1_i1:155-796(-)